MNYHFDESNLEKVFDELGNDLRPLDDDEVTAAMMAKKYPQLGHRQWLNRLHKGVKDGKYTVRYGKRGECIFKPVTTG